METGPGENEGKLIDGSNDRVILAVALYVTEKIQMGEIQCHNIS